MVPQPDGIPLPEKVVVPDGFAMRALAPADLPAAQALLDTCESADVGEPCVHEMDLAVESQSSHFEFDVNTWLVLDGDGGFAALGWLWTPHDDRIVTADFYVRPDCRDKGLDEALLDAIEARARVYAPAGPSEDRAGTVDTARSDGAAKLVVFVEPVLEARRALVLERGFTIVRQIFQMRLDFTQPPTEAESPSGVVVRPIRLGEDDRRVHAASEEAFSEHFLYWPTPYDEWRRRTVEREAVDPSLWLVAWDGDEVAGQVWVLQRGSEVLVEDLSVRRPWRGRGLGLALLQTVFARVAARGFPFVRLFVDAQNATGALELYVKAGMRQERRFEVFEKLL
jgi:mycothiol synthase